MCLLLLLTFVFLVVDLCFFLVVFVFVIVDVCGCSVCLSLLLVACVALDGVCVCCC